MDPKNHKDEAHLDQDLESIRAGYAALEAVEPPDLVDQAVLNAARRAAARGPKRRPLRWIGAFATASVVVLALTIVLQQDRMAPDGPAPEGIELDRAEPAVRRKDAVSGERAREMKARAAQLPAAPPAAAQQSVPESEPQAEPVGGKPGIAAGADLEEAPVEEFGQDELRADELQSRTSALGQLKDDAAAPMSESEAAANEALPNPEEWIDHLISLQRSGQHEQFEIELSAFRETYPDYPLPPELRN